MIEMLGVLAIIGVLSVGGIAGYSKAMLKYKTNKTIDQITMLTTNIRTLYAQQDVFTGLNTSVHGVSGDTLGVVPDELQGDDNTLVNPFSGSVVVKEQNSVTGEAGANRAFVIEVNGIPKEACMAIATSDWGSNYSSGLIGMAVGSSSVSDAYSSALDYIFSPAYAAVTAGMDLDTDAKAGTALATVYAGCPSDTLGATGGAGELVSASGTKSKVICAKNMPISVAAASAACNCNGSECSVAFKYY